MPDRAKPNIRVKRAATFAASARPTRKKGRSAATRRPTRTAQVDFESCLRWLVASASTTGPLAAGTSEPRQLRQKRDTIRRNRIAFRPNYPAKINYCALEWQSVEFCAITWRLNCILIVTPGGKREKTPNKSICINMMELRQDQLQ